MVDPVSRKINTSNLKSVSALLNKHKIDYCVFFGTALRVYREQGIIGHDDDIDILVDAKSYQKVLDLFGGTRVFIGLKGRGLRFGYHLTKHVQENILCQFSKTHYLQKEGFRVMSYIDFYFYLEDTNTLVEKWNFSGDWKNHANHLHIPKSLILPTKEIALQGFTTRVPNKLLESCQFLYGERFLEPLRKFVDYEVNIKNNKPFIQYFKPSRADSTRI